jgi:hypothetical protein
MHQAVRWRTTRERATGDALPLSGPPMYRVDYIRSSRKASRIGGSGIRDSGFGIRDQKFLIPDP